MRLAVDLTACHLAGSTYLAFVEAMIGSRGSNDLYAVVDAMQMDSAEALRQRVCPQLPPAQFVSCLYPDFRETALDPHAHSAIATALRDMTYQSLMPDAVMVANPFLGEFNASRPDIVVSAGVRVCLLLDSVPHHPQPDSSPESTRRHALRLAALQTCDLILTTSEAVRISAMTLAGIDAERIIDVGLPADAVSAWRAIDNAVSSYAPSHRLQEKRVALVCPAGFAERHYVTLQEQLSGDIAIDIYIEEHTPHAGLSARNGDHVYPHTQLAARRDDYVAVLYTMANHASHAFMLPIMEECPGILVLEDASLDAPVAELAARLHAPHLKVREAFYGDGLRALVGPASNHPPMLNRRVIELCDYLIMSDAIAKFVTGDNWKHGWRPPMAIGTDTSSAIYMNAIQASRMRSATRPMTQLADALCSVKPDPSVLDTITQHAATNANLRKQPRLLVDVTQLATAHARSGIQRVVRSIAREMGASEKLDRPFELVQQTNGKLWRASGVIGSIFGLDAMAIPAQEITIQPGDTLLMIDSSWEQYHGFRHIFQAVRQMGGRVVTVVYDLIPLLLPDLCSPGLTKIFQQWFALAIEQSDLLLCISRAVADEVKVHLAGRNLSCPVAIDHWRLGADIGIAASESSIRPQVRALASDTGSPLFLMVGTVEPRKGHDFALDAFEQLWQEGSEVRLCIAGSIGWMVTDTLKRIRQHPQLNKKLFFIEQFTDAEIALCYQAASALIAASVAEGFGLPIVEAALHSVPAIVSDIPVFREVGGDSAVYFSRQHARHLADAIRSFLAMPLSEKIPAATNVVTWRQSADFLLTAIGCAQS